MKILLALSLILLNTVLVHSGPIQDGVYYIINRSFLQVIQIPDWSYADGAEVNFDDITGGDNQKFQLTSVGDFYKITAVYSGKLLTVPSSMTTGDASQVTQWSDNSEDLQQWTIFAQDYNGFYKVQSRYSGKVLTAQRDYSWPIDWAVAADASASASASAPADVGEGQMKTSMIPPMPWYSWKTKLIQSTIGVGNAYQDFLFVKVTGYESLVGPVLAVDSPAIEEPVQVETIDVMRPVDNVEMAAKQSAVEVTPTDKKEPVKEDKGPLAAENPKRTNTRPVAVGEPVLVAGKEATVEENAGHK